MIVPSRPAEPVPVIALGIEMHDDGSDSFRFLKHGGVHVIPYDALVTRPVLIALCGGESWLRRTFPGEFVILAERAGGGRRVPTGFNALAAATHLAKLCLDAEAAALARQAFAPPRRGWWERFADWTRWISGPVAACF